MGVLMKKKILVIDDEKGSRDLFVYLLEPEGYEVKAARDGLEGLEMFKNDIFDIIFLDVHMPNMNGPETLRAIKQIRPEQAVVIFSSSLDSSLSFETQSKKMGACACLYKPVDINDILQLVKNSGSSSHD